MLRVPVQLTTRDGGRASRSTQVERDRVAGRGLTHTDVTLRGVTRRVKRQVGIDYLRLSGPKHRVQAVRDLLDHHGFIGKERVRGRYFYAGGEKRTEGCCLFWDDDDAERAGMLVEIPGGALALMDSQERIDILNELLRLGLVCTRIDVAVDLFDLGFDLIGEAVAAAERGALCGARSFEEIKSCGGTKGHTLYLGKRGRHGSGRFARLYDKGLESGDADRFEWTRIEVEYSADCAEQMATIIASDHDPHAVMKASVWAAFDFREPTGLVDDRASRRFRCEFWEAVREGDFDRVTAQKRSTTLDRYRTWMCKSVAPLMEAMAAESGLSLSCVWDDLCRSEGIPLKVADASRVVVAEFIADIEGRRDRFAEAHA